MISIPFVIIGIVLVFLTLGVLFLLPAEKNHPKPKKKRAPEVTEDWQAVSKRLEKHVLQLRDELAATKKKERSLEKEVLIQKDKYVKIQEKMSQERQWQEKEHDDIEKRSKELTRLEDNLKGSEQNLEREHKQRLMYERELKESKDALAAGLETKRSLEMQLAKANAQSDVYRKEITELREQIGKISRKQEDTTFISKSEHEKALQELAQLKKQLNQPK
jgi:hypothetical protein